MTPAGTARRRGLSVRMRLTLSYAGFLVVAGTVMFAGLLLVLRYVPDENLTVMRGGGFAPDRSDLLDVAVPISAAAVGFLALVGLAGGWVLAGRMLRPLDRIGEAAALAAGGSLTHRIALDGPDDELRRLADTFDLMLARLERAFENQRRFTANASHELRTPNTVMKALIEVAQADPAGRDVDRLLERLHETNERSIGIVESLLRLARLDHSRGGRGDLLAEPADLADVARAALAAVPDTAAPGAPRIVPVLGAAPVRGDRALLEQLAGNLVGNAVRHNLRAGGTVWLTTGPDDQGRSALVVESTGEPLDTQAVDTLVEPFVRAADRTRRQGRVPGSGLGLAIVAAVARAHDADLALRARPGGGLRVTVTFPAAAQREASAG
ncbi:sensor histidine kinase [Promicromonospora thailandica]|uniref:histidine kinase n=1 Tax=Promicromonospora thailandica TaxID=765201 RepID=A0A9X2GDF6_9MICO|nr:HAMP domain-containing sensor histidine kinase [Promicromonospora thailandica]MCP2266586.1 two-component system, OmpR family, sensor histidine kinase VanS [Promicromonospora thailandica]BFF17339.1 HAMP domain-containing sensor histidine kinase [Promicromonospora thailandica]